MTIQLTNQKHLDQFNSILSQHDIKLESVTIEKEKLDITSNPFDDQPYSRILFSFDESELSAGTLINIGSYAERSKPSELRKETCSRTESDSQSSWDELYQVQEIQALDKTKTLVSCVGSGESFFTELSYDDAIIFYRKNIKH